VTAFQVAAPGPDPDGPASAEPAAAPAAPAAPEARAEKPAAHPSPAQEIRLELSGGERRVEIRVSGQAGDLKVAVRTPDHALAERLREDLPALSSRLEAGGMRAESWHPAAESGRTAGIREAAASLAGQDRGEPQGQSGGGRHQQHQQDESRRPRPFGPDQQDKQKGEDFAWYLSATPTQ
jgi:hypothetical protein